MADEEWRPVPDYVCLYEASDLGRIRSLDRTVQVRGGGRGGGQSIKRITGRVLALNGPGPNGYMSVHLMREGVRAAFSVHTIIAAAFLGPCPPGHEVAHGDGCRTNNRAANLRYATKVDNHADKLRHGTSLRGERQHQAVLTEADVIEIKRLLKSCPNRAEVARKFPQVTYAAIRDIHVGRNWKHVPS